MILAIILVLLFIHITYKHTCSDYYENKIKQKTVPFPYYIETKKEDDLFIVKIIKSQELFNYKESLSEECYCWKIMTHQRSSYKKLRDCLNDIESFNLRKDV